MRTFSTALIYALLVLPLPGAAQTAETFTNPLLESGADPWVTFHNGFYYYMNTTGVNLTIWRTRDVTDLSGAEKKVVWVPPAEGPYSHDIWAPELHRLKGKWYIYFAADAGTNETHRIWVLENGARDPLTGTWQLRGKVADESDKWAIDASVFEHRRRIYVVWSGWEGNRNGAQNIYIARLEKPWKVEGNRVLISKPELPWETIGDLRTPQPGGITHVNVNEGPEILQHDHKIFLTYSASGCWTDNYALGLLTASDKADVLKPLSWRKSPKPVFSESPKAHAYGTGHNSFFRSPDRKQNWIIYHANPEPHEGCGRYRSPRAQPFTFDTDGLPDFGTPIPIDVPLKKPSGTGATISGTQ